MHIFLETRGVRITKSPWRERTMLKADSQHIRTKPIGVELDWALSQSQSDS
uniref:Uncharacterized protein n=1 Tax=Anguilla anguilla TaxID=7936 RepID=A0A0E9UFY2_ANGAN